MYEKKKYLSNYILQLSGVANISNSCRRQFENYWAKKETCLKNNKIVVGGMEAEEKM